jgi:hypothetical protein
MEINDKIVTHVENFICKTRHLPRVKFRFILGRYSKHFGFEPHIFQKEKYEEIKVFLESCVSWENVENMENEVNTESSESPKSLESSERPESIIICTNGSYDLMVTYISNVNISGIRKITAFNRKCHSFVLSTIKNELNEIYYTFEIIASVPLNYTSKYISDSSLLKVRDILTKINADLDLQFEIIK